MWFKTDRDLMVGDLFYFMKKDSALGDNTWSMGMMETANKGMDGIIREVGIQVCSSSEQNLSQDKGDTQPNSTYPRYTKRAVTKLIKILGVENTHLAEEEQEDAADENQG